MYTDSFLPTLQPETTKNTYRIKKVPCKSITSPRSLPQLNPDLMVHRRVHTIHQQNKYNTNKLEQEEIKALLDKSSEFHPADKVSQQLVGNDAFIQFYRHYKKIDRVEQENDIYDLPPSLYTSMHTSASAQYLLPCKIGLLKYQGPADSIKIPCMRYGDNYMHVLSEGVKHSPISLEVFQFEGNRITTKSSGSLLQVISKNAKELNFSKNRIGAIGVQPIAKSLESRDCRIEILEIEDNNLGDKLVSQLCQALLKNSTVIRLNLSKNYIQNGNYIAQLLNENNTLQELYLHWNQIRAEGGKAIFLGLMTNIYLRVLDLSCNSLAGCSQQISDFMVKNRELVHLDLSFNSFNDKESQIISEGLNQNQSIYGFHFQGNHGRVDSLGFLIVGSSDDSGSFTTRIDACKYRGSHRAKDVCWICEGWQEHEFKWSQPSEPLFLHLNFQDYEGVYFGKNEYKMIRMVPPGYVTYFFSVGEDTQMISEVESKFDHNFSEKVKLIDRQIMVTLKSLNRFLETPDRNLIDQYYSTRISVKPRTPNPIYIRPKFKKQKVIWTFPISLFKDWRRDNEELLKQCFETDWNMTRIPKIIKNEADLENTKQYMRSIYPQLKETYRLNLIKTNLFIYFRHYSSFNPVGDVWAIQANAFMTFLQAVKLLDPPVEEDPEKLARSLKAVIKPQDLDLKFIGTLSGTEKGNPRKPERGLIRFQFMEVLVRIAEEKYLKNGVSSTMCDSMKYLWEDNLKDECMQYNSQLWRDNKYWNEQCDYCLKFYRPIIDYLYAKYSVKKVLNVKPGQKNFMCLQELLDLTSLSQLNSLDHFASGVPYFAFNKSMMTQVDELKQDRIFQMSFVEFLEALARIAEEACLEPYQGAFPGDVEWNIQKLRELPLNYKIESLLILLLDRCSDPAFKANYKKPDQSFFTPKIESDEEQ